MSEWINSEDVFKVIADSVNGRWDWSRSREFRCKYIELRVDMRDGHCLLFDRDGNDISLDELRYQRKGG